MVTQRTAGARRRVRVRGACGQNLRPSGSGPGQQATGRSHRGREKARPSLHCPLCPPARQDQTRPGPVAHTGQRTGMSWDPARAGGVRVGGNTHGLSSYQRVARPRRPALCGPGALGTGTGLDGGFKLHQRSPPSPSSQWVPGRGLGRFPREWEPGRACRGQGEKSKGLGGEG